MKNLGEEMEIIAARFVSAIPGYRLRESNWRLGNRGEIDLIFDFQFDKAGKDLNTYFTAKPVNRSSLVFVEVRSKNSQIMHPSQYVGYEKLAKLKFLIKAYVVKHNISIYKTSQRLDIITYTSDTNYLQMNWYQNIMF